MNNDRNDVNKQNKHINKHMHIKHSEKENTGMGWLL